MSNKIYPSLACRLEFFAEDSSGLPVSGLTHSDVSAAGYCRIQDGVMSSTTSLSLTSSAAYTASVSSGQFITIDSSRGHYAIDCPSGASAIAYDYVLASVTFTAGHTVTAIQHEIDATLYLTTANNATLGALSGRIPAALVSGRMDCSVGAMAADVVTAAAIASNALSIAKFAADIGTTAYASNPLAKAVWERLLSAMTTAGSAGKKLSDQANADVSALALQSTLNAVGVLATSIDAKTSQLAFTTPNKVDATAVLDSAGSDWTAEERAQIRYQLGIDGTATAPTAPVTSPVVIVPSGAGKTTCYALCVDRRGDPKEGVAVYCWLAKTRPAGAGIIADDLVEVFTSGENGVVQIPDRMKGFAYAFAIGGTANPIIFPISATAGETTPIPDLIS